MSKKILMIDDDDELVESVKILLEAKGYEFLSAPSSAEGFEMERTAFSHSPRCYDDSRQ